MKLYEGKSRLGGRLAAAFLVRDQNLGSSEAFPETAQIRASRRITSRVGHFASETVFSY